MKRITKKGYDGIIAEINQLWEVERPIVVEEVYQAALLGDRSENAAYIYGKQRLRKIDSRIRYLKKKLDGVKIVNTVRLPQKDRIDFGAWVEIEDQDGHTKTFQLVDQRESDPEKQRISIQSPIGSALMGCKEGESIDISLPKGAVCFDILSVYYGPNPLSTSSNETSSTEDLP